MKKFRRVLTVAACVSLMTAILFLSGCQTAATATTSSAASEQATVAGSSAAAESSSAVESTESGKPYFALVAKGFQFQYWQVVMQGAQKAADELGATITFDGPESQSDIDGQVNMISNVLAKDPNALCIAALDTEAVLPQLAEAKEKGITVIGFDSGIPDAPEGQVAATAATDNVNAAMIGADYMFDDPTFQAKVKAATADMPVVIGVLLESTTSQSLTDRASGFIDEMKAKIETLDGFADAVEVSGNPMYEAAATGDVKVKITVNVPPSSSATDEQNLAQTLLGTDNLIAIFCSHQGTADGLIAATNDGTDLDRSKGTFKDITVVGFDAGAGQKTCVRNGWFLGSITQDPYMIGYDTVQLAFAAYNGEKIADVDTGAKWYDASNMDNDDIIDLLYD